MTQIEVTYRTCNNKIYHLQQVFQTSAKAIASNGVQKVQDMVLQFMQPYVQSDGHVVYKNKFRIAIAEK